MGVIRRNSDWRLEKRGEGLYEVTRNHHVQLKIITADYTSQGFIDERSDFSVPVREVESYAQAESLFDGIAEGQRSTAGTVSPAVGANDVPALEISDMDVELSDVPPLLLLIAGLIVGGLLVRQSGLATDSPLFLIGAAFLILPLGVIAIASLKYSREGLDAAVEFLLTPDDPDTASASTDSRNVEKTPPTPEKLKNDLYFDRANQRCEWCGNQINHHHTHHITPRSEGGPNEPANLIVLCPNCHAEADSGLISQSKLRRRVADRSAETGQESG